MRDDILTKADFWRTMDAAGEPVQGMTADLMATLILHLPDGKALGVFMAVGAYANGRTDRAALEERLLAELPDET